jgi:tetratricopeptide (TPR) repeat protein
MSNQAKTWETKHQLGDSLLEQELFEQAVIAYRDAIALNPDIFWSYHKLGDTFVKLQQWEDAILVYRKAIELNPNFTWSYSCLGNVLSQQGCWNDAILAYHQAIKLEPNQGWFHKFLGDAFQHIAQYPDAIACYQTAIQLQPDVCWFYAGLGQTLIKQEQWEDAIAPLIEALKIRPDYLEIYDNFATIFDKQGQQDWANICLKYKKLPEQIIKKYCRLNPDSMITSDLDNNTINIPLYPSHSINLLPSRTSNNQILLPAHIIDVPEAYVAIVTEGRAWGDALNSAIFTSENKLITNIFTGCPQLIHSSDKLPPPELIEGTVAFLSVRWGQWNYFHWMFDLVTRIHLLQKSGINLHSINKFVVNSLEYSYQRETLETLGIPLNKIIESRTLPHIKAENLVVPSLPYPSAYRKSKWACDFLQQSFVAMTVSPTNTKLERIYISRENASYRRVINEQEILNFLEPLGFKSIILETMSVVEQATLFAGARVIIAPHGAGLTNLVFCQRETKFIEMFSPFYLVEDFLILASVSGLPHYSLIGEMLEADPAIPANCQDILVNLEELKQLIKMAGV